MHDSRLGYRPLLILNFEKMTQSESDKNAYDAYEQLCKENGNMVSLMQLRIMVRAMGAERSFAICVDMPNEVKHIMLAVCRHIETTNVTN